MPQMPSNLLIIFPEQSMMRKNIQFGKKYGTTCFESQLNNEKSNHSFLTNQKIGGRGY